MLIPSEVHAHISTRYTLTAHTVDSIRHLGFSNIRDRKDQNIKVMSTELAPLVEALITQILRNGIT